MANYGHSRKKHNFATTFFATNKPLTTAYNFFGLKQNKPRKNTTNRLPKSSEIWNFDCQLLPLTFFCISYFWKMEKQNRKMSVNEFIIQYCTLWKITYSNFKRFAQNCKKKYSIYFLLYISLSKKSSHSYQGIWPVHVFSLRYYLDTSLKETLSNFTQIQFIGLGVLVVIFEPEVQPVAKPVSARPQVRFSTMF